MFPELLVWLFLFFEVSTRSTAAEAQGKRTALSFNLRAQYFRLGGFGDLDGRLEELDSKSTPTWLLQARPTTVYRPRSQAGLQQARARSLRNGQSEKVEWETAEILGPDIEDKHTLVQLARMTGNAYALPGKKNWYDIDPMWNNVNVSVLPFGVLLYSHLLTRL